NAPVLDADELATGLASRAEVQLDGISAVRIDQDARVAFTNLDAGYRQLRLVRGTIELRLFHDGDGASVETPTTLIREDRAGRYRIDVLPDGTTHVGATRADDFDRWNDARDADAQAALASDHADRQVAGMGELAAYGRWMNLPQYGDVWAPNVSSDWSPYHAGQWITTPFYNQTWVGAEPWGWAPYHFGSWFFTPGIGWAWYPGGIPIWSPALVSFFGLGGGLIGWTPLAPFQTLQPWWGTGVANFGTYLNGLPRTLPNVARQSNAMSSAPVQRFMTIGPMRAPISWPSAHALSPGRRPAATPARTSRAPASAQHRRS
ncbi:MAG: FecR domain-containing protein, partial [Candidatus Eremiobacteraeota bacterium]|nr:FecR domain-containing protein [Candidatus Eremiobacteraeota bacterium]